MKRRIVMLTIALAVVFLFTCLAYAADSVCSDVSNKCPKKAVCIVHPKGNEHMVPEEDWYVTEPWPPAWPKLPLVSGSTYPVVVKVDPLAFPTNAPVAKYVLLYSCDGTNPSLNDPKDYIGIRYCSPESHCYPCFSWVVPVVGTTQTNCKVKVVLYDAANNKVGSAMSLYPFTIVPACPPGGCPTICGDGACEGAETCSTCPQDCGACP